MAAEVVPISAAWTLEELKERKKRIRRAMRPAEIQSALAIRREEQKHICDLCPWPIQDLALAHLDHGISVDYYARSPLSIQDAIQACNAMSNLSAVHATCSQIKGNMSRGHWYSEGWNKFMPEPRVYTDAELSGIVFKRAQVALKGGVAAGEKNKQNGTGFCDAAISAMGGAAIVKKNRENGTSFFDPTFASDCGKRGGKIGGKKNRQNRTGIFAPGMASRGTRVRNELYGVPRNGNHVRWHLKRGEPNPDCELCRLNQMQQAA